MRRLGSPASIRQVLNDSRNRRPRYFDNGTAGADTGPTLPLRMVVEAARVAALQAYIVPQTAAAEPYVTLVRITANLLQAPVAMISLIDRDDQWIKAAFGTNLQKLPRAFAICNHVIVEPSGAMVIPDTLADPRFQSHPLVLGPPHVRFYAGVCLVDSDGYVLGTLCVMDEKPGVMNAESLALLRKMAVEAVDALVRQRAGLGSWQDGAGSTAYRPDEHWRDDGPSRRAADPDPDSYATLHPPRISTHGWLGVRTEQTPLPGRNQQGRLLTSVAVGSPAERVGLQVGDVIIAIDGRETRRRNDITLAMSSCAVGDVMRLRVWRDNKVFDRDIRLEPMPRERKLQHRAS